MEKINYISPDWIPVLESNKLLSFESLWDCQAEWVEKPNDDRGGASGVSRLILKRSDENTVSIYLKRQQNHTRRTFLHPMRGEPTFAREFVMMSHLRQHKLLTPFPIFYGEQYKQNSLCAILVTEELAGYRSLEELTSSRISFHEKRVLLAKIASTVKEMHLAGVQHRSLYPKHLFIKSTVDGFSIALIDLEKSRKVLLPWLGAIADLITLNYRASGWSKADRLFFFKQYLGISRLGWWSGMLCRYIYMRSKQKLHKRARNK